MGRITMILWACLQFNFICAQGNKEDKQPDFLGLPWRMVATGMPEGWYGTAEAKRVAANVLFCQKDIGGWEKNKPYHHPLTAKDSAEIIAAKLDAGATIDNGATTTEMMFLANMYRGAGYATYYQAFEKAFNYLLQAQYKNGGWPQFYPLQKGKTAGYASHITYNDNAMVNVLSLLQKIWEGAPQFSEFPITDGMRQKAGVAYNRGVDCILKTQIIVNGVPTVWCAQHDENSLLPAGARAFELASFSGGESVGILLFLMEVKAPSAVLRNAVVDAMKWFDQHKLTGIKVENRPGSDGKRNMVVVEDSSAAPLLARFYDLETGKPFFCDRDGVKKPTLAEIGDERRNGYSWYVNSYELLKKQFDKWADKWKVRN